MSMFSYFPGNPGWSYHFTAPILNLARMVGAGFDEAHRVAERIKVGDGESWYSEWQRAGERVERVAESALKAGRHLTARDAYLRGSNYYRTAQFYLLGSDERKKNSYLQCVACFERRLLFSVILI